MLAKNRFLIKKNNTILIRWLLLFLLLLNAVLISMWDYLFIDCVSQHRHLATCANHSSSSQPVDPKTSPVFHDIARHHASHLFRLFGAALMGDESLSMSGSPESSTTQSILPISILGTNPKISTPPMIAAFFAPCPSTSNELTNMRITTMRVHAQGIVSAPHSNPCSSSNSIVASDSGIAQHSKSRRDKPVQQVLQQVLSSVSASASSVHELQDNAEMINAKDVFRNTTPDCTKPSSSSYSIGSLLGYWFGYGAVKNITSVTGSPHDPNRMQRRHAVKRSMSRTGLNKVTCARRLSSNSISSRTITPISKQYRSSITPENSELDTANLTEASNDDIKDNRRVKDVIMMNSEQRRHKARASVAFMTHAMAATSSNPISYSVRLVCFFLDISTMFLVYL